MPCVREKNGSDAVVRLFRSHFGHSPSSVERLPGGGSEKLFFRLIYGEEKVVGVFFDAVGENRRLIELTRVFMEIGLPVPRIVVHAANGFAYLVEDLGGENLAENLARTLPKPESVELAYAEVLLTLEKMHFEGGRALEARGIFLPLQDRSDFEADLHYFESRFVTFFGLQKRYGTEVAEELKGLAAELGSLPPTGFVAGDFQSRNLMKKEGKFYFIDFQNGKRGSILFDFASLLYGSSSHLCQGAREKLMRRFHRAGMAGTLEFEDFTRLLHRFVMMRRIRSLGTYGDLGFVKRKRAFAVALLPSLLQLRDMAELPFFPSFPKFFRFLASILDHEAPAKFNPFPEDF